LRAVHSLGGGGLAAQDVATADDYRNLSSKVMHLRQLTGEVGQDFGVDAIALLAHQRLTAELEQNSLVLGRRLHEELPLMRVGARQKAQIREPGP
jgi:hypothetical protein